MFRQGPPTVRIRDTDVPNLIGVKHSSRNLTEHLVHQTTLRTVRDQLGAFDACARDTVLATNGGSIVVSSTALWQRAGAMVLFDTRVTHRAPASIWSARPPGTTPATAHLPELTMTYEVVRSGWFPTGGTSVVPTRTDAGCSIEQNELVALAVPMDSLAFRALRERLRRRPSVVARP